MNKKHKVVLANPPFSAEWDSGNVKDDIRFNGLVAPKKKNDLLCKATSY